MRIKRIIVPTDFSKNAQMAFEAAYSLAVQVGGTVYLLHVHDEQTTRSAVEEGLVPEGMNGGPFDAAAQEIAGMRFSEMLAGLSPQEVPIETVLRAGDPKATIVEFADEIDADLVVMGMRGASKVDKVLILTLLGSVSDSVMRASPCPVLVIRQDHKRW
jgi:nucleotide-binding universal stress UspA family protein